MQFINKKHFPKINTILPICINFVHDGGQNNKSKDFIEVLGQALVRKYVKYNHIAVLFLINTSEKLDIDIKLVIKNDNHLLEIKIIKTKQNKNTQNSAVAKLNLKNYIKKLSTNKNNSQIAISFFALPMLNIFDVNLNINAYLFKNINLYLANDVILLKNKDKKSLTKIFLTKMHSIIEQKYQSKMIKIIKKYIKTESKAQYSLLDKDLGQNVINIHGQINVKYNILQFAGNVIAVPQFRILPATIKAEHSLLIYRLDKHQQAYLRTRNIDVKYFYDRFTNATSSL